MKANVQMLVGLEFYRLQGPEMQTGLTALELAAPPEQASRPAASLPLVRARRLPLLPPCTPPSESLALPPVLAGWLGLQGTGGAAGAARLIGRA
ncbi:hypothetical protein GPECTOR_144g734 [Gonium pectorale]|uniref:Uncharacterized protein n=1 Tax=Gonium pectorale TaxID=33097 RepID=A0A150FXX5_GONPE|nr:hypothetical protein GPECTOR_144g734 [Gonium pectorale]|eukprot:KXZ42471.1 hypothetical protein GPECTOR_144g734 [Gonium pectorale]